MIKTTALTLTLLLGSCAPRACSTVPVREASAPTPAVYAVDANDGPIHVHVDCSTLNLTLDSLPDGGYAIVSIGSEPPLDGKTRSYSEVARQVTMFGGDISWAVAAYANNETIGVVQGKTEGCA